MHGREREAVFRHLIDLLMNGDAVYATRPSLCAPENKGGRRWRPSAERAVVRAVRVAGGSGTCANESRTIHAKLGPKMVTNWQGGGGGKAAKSVEYGRSYPVRTEEPVRREGATGPERPKRMRPDGAVCYVEGKNGGLGVKRRHVQQGEQPGRPPGRPPEG